MTIPIIGKYYHFFEKGDLKINKHFICRCEKIITLEETKGLLLNYQHEKLDSLYNIWQKILQEEKNLYVKTFEYSDETDIFVEISCPKFDSEFLWCVRTKDGNLRSLNIQNNWQNGVLDTNNELLNSAIRFYPEFKDNYLNKTY